MSLIEQSNSSAAWTEVDHIESAYVPPSSSLQEHDPRWIHKLETRIQLLISLPENWDSYGARRISASSAIGALEVAIWLTRTAEQDTGQPFLPDLIPTSNGTVQAEWTVGENCVEVEALSRTNYSVYSHLPNGEEKEYDLDFDFSELTEQFRELFLVLDTEAG